ncbi:MAG: PKD domain-containing protein [Candidatus Promineifilaceae bacterium]|nr:PKD domain-containing protein [Candidatus Promineifilaceae bacterium]
MRDYDDFRPPMARISAGQLIKWMKKCSILLTLILVVLLLGYSSASGGEEFGYIDLVNRLEVDRFDLVQPTSLTTGPTAGVLMLLEGNKNRVHTISTFGDLHAIEGIEGLPGGVQHIEYDARSGSLLTFDPIRQQLRTARGDRGTAVTLPLKEANGIAVDPTSGDAYLLHSKSGRLLRVDGAGIDVPFPASQISRPVSTLVLSGEVGDLQGLAFEPVKRHLFSINVERMQLVEYSLRGERIRVYDLSPFELTTPVALTFAPSTNQTDAPSVYNLFIATGGMDGDIWEFTLDPKAAAAFHAAAAPLVQTIATWQFYPPSPDASGITYLPHSNSLLEADSEVNEKPVYQGTNQFEMALNGSLIRTYDTTHFSMEPTGAAYDPDRNHLFLTDDNVRQVYEVDLSYNQVNSFSVAVLDSKLVDPEGIAYNSWNGRLYIAGGISEAIFWIDPGSDNNFGTSDDMEGSFPATNLADPEGITFNFDQGTIFAVGKEDVVAEYTAGGSVVQMIDIAAADAHKPAGLAYGPTSVGGGKSIYVSDRGHDADSDINGGKGDGMIYEFALGALPGPTADFEANPTSGAIPLTVNFSNSSSGFYETCLWNFGDGVNSTVCENPTHEYANPGTYQVSLTVSGSSGEDTRVKSGYIVASGPLTADFVARPSSGITPLPVTFTNLSTGDYNSCLWEFGDGDSSSNCVNAQHLYTSAGSYTVSLTVSGAGGSQTKTRVEHITVSEAGNANFSADPTQGTAPLAVNFNNLSLGDFDSCQWDFGDGSSSQSCGDPVHTYTTPGIYAVTLTITEGANEDSVTFTDLIAVYEEIEANFEADPKTGVQPLGVNFSNLSSGAYLTCAWDFGDGGTSSSCANPNYVYTTAGLYTVSLRVEGPGGSHSKTAEGFLNIEEATVSFSATPRAGEVPLEVFFDNLSEGTYDICQWNFGDGATSSECDNPSHIYTVPGSYTVALEMNGASGPHFFRMVDYISAQPNVMNLPLIVARGHKK